jgi:fatty-acyl-CoA synthase
LTEHSSRGHQAKKGLAFAHIAFTVSVLAAVYMLLVMMATHVGYFSLDLGFRTLTLNYGPKVAMAALIICGLSLLIAVFKAPGRTLVWAIAGLVISGALMGGFYAYQRALKAFPPIADVATDWDRPLDFSDKMIEERGRDAMRVEDLPRVPRNESMEWGGRTVADINEATCPGAKTIVNKAVTEDQIVNLLRSENYIVFGHAPWRVEATYQDNFYGFKSDVVVRIDPRTIDVRSIGRYDLPDLGANCRRVTELVNKIKAL